MKWIASQIMSMIVDAGNTSFGNYWGKFRLFRIKNRLKKELSIEILNVYGNEIYYNELDVFLRTNKVILNLIVNCESTPIHQYESRNKMVHYYVQLFIEKHPTRICFKTEIYYIIQKYFDVIFRTLNDVDSDDSVRKIANVAKELAGELSFEISEIRSELHGIKDKIDRVIESTRNESDDITNISIERYFEYLTRLCHDTKNSSYLTRNLYFKDEDDKNVDVLAALMRHRRILLLGEAGYGKTFESIELLRKVCSSSKEHEFLPFYLPLYEYGTLYLSIIDGIKYKLRPFCNFDTENSLRKWFESGKIILILDGVDDIETYEAKNKFIAETKNFSLHYEHCFMFITSRQNRYGGEFGEISEYFLRGLNRDTIRKQLIDERIYIDIPESYFQLFENPMFFDVGKKVLKQNSHRELFNRSILFEELMLMLCGEWDKKKGISTMLPLSYSEIIGLLGSYAFDTFSKPFSRLLEFDQYVLRNNIHDTGALVISILLHSEVLRVTDKITFAHKLFKEFCAAYHLVNAFPITEHRSLYSELINSGEWKEVFIFASGMYTDIEQQDEFLDFIMGNNIKLYIECINAKSDLSSTTPVIGTDIYVKRYLNQILKTYTFIVNQHFEPLVSFFDPKPGLNEDCIAKNKIRIVGTMSQDRSHMNYWFDRVMSNEEDVLCINEDLIMEYQKQRESQAIVERKSITSRWINLGMSGLVGDSGRKVAIDSIKKEIKAILEQKKLKESKYLLCERLHECQRKVKEIRDVSILEQMHSIVNAMIDKVKEGTTNLQGYTHGGVDMFYVNTLLNCIVDNNIDFENCLLPKEDNNEKDSGWIWDRYTNDQKENRISKFFYFHQISYLEMVKVNFPVLHMSFSRFLDSPYQNIVYVDPQKNMDKNNMFAEPLLTYYYIASTTAYPALPEIRYNSRVDALGSISENIYSEIEQSYLKKGKKAHAIGYTQTGFSFITSSRRNGGDTPLSDYVYATVRNSIEEIFGKL